MSPPFYLFLFSLFLSLVYPLKNSILARHLTTSSSFSTIFSTVIATSSFLSLLLAYQTLLHPLYLLLLIYSSLSLFISALSSLIPCRCGFGFLSRFSSNDEEMFCVFICVLYMFLRVCVVNYV